MSRQRFAPSPELKQVGTSDGLPRIATPFGRAWLATRYDDARAVLGDSVTFSTGGLASLQRLQANVGAEVAEQDTSGILVTYDPPEHTRLRRMLTPEFTKTSGAARTQLPAKSTRAWS